MCENLIGDYLKAKQEEQISSQNTTAKQDSEGGL